MVMIVSPARGVEAKKIGGGVSDPPPPPVPPPVMPNAFRPDVRPTYFSPSMRSPVFSSTASRPGAVSIEAQYANQVPIERQGANSLTGGELTYASAEYGLRGALPLSYGTRERVPSRLRQARGVEGDTRDDSTRMLMIAGIGAALVLGGLMLAKSGRRKQGRR